MKDRIDNEQLANFITNDNADPNVSRWTAVEIRLAREVVSLLMIIRGYKETRNELKSRVAKLEAQVKLLQAVVTILEQGDSEANNGDE